MRVLVVFARSHAYLAVHRHLIATEETHDECGKHGYCCRGDDPKRIGTRAFHGVCRGISEKGIRGTSLVGLSKIWSIIHNAQCAQCNKEQKKARLRMVGLRILVMHVWWRGTEHQLNRNTDRNSTGIK